MSGYFPVHCIGSKQLNPFCIKLAIGKVDLPKPKPVTRTAKMGGHEWKKGPKGLKCAVGHATAPLYKSLSEFFLVKEACPLPVYISLTRWDPAESVSVSFVVVDTVLGLA